jgi:hypothetical protein
LCQKVDEISASLFGPELMKICAKKADEISALLFGPELTKNCVKKVDDQFDPASPLRRDCSGLAKPKPTNEFRIYSE